VKTNEIIMKLCKILFHNIFITYSLSEKIMKNDESFLMAIENTLSYYVFSCTENVMAVLREKSHENFTTSDLMYAICKNVMNS